MSGLTSAATGLRSVAVASVRARGAELVRVEGRIFEHEPQADRFACQPAGVAALFSAKVPLSLDVKKLIWPLFFKGLALLVDFLARAYRDFGFRHLVREH